MGERAQLGAHEAEIPSITQTPMSEEEYQKECGQILQILLSNQSFADRIEQIRELVCPVCEDGN